MSTAGAPILLRSAFQGDYRAVRFFRRATGHRKTGEPRFGASDDVDAARWFRGEIECDVGSTDPDLCHCL